MKVLQIDSSPLGEASASRQLTAAAAAGLLRANPAASLTHRDLSVTTPAHLSGEILAALGGADTSGNPELQKQVALGEELITEFLAADVIIIGAPMYNFSIPSQLKAWIDRIARAGRTFRYTETGPVGLVTGKRVIIASSRGSVFAGDAAHEDGWRHAMDFQEDYLKRVLGFLGVTDVEIVRAEGLGISPASREQSIAKARQQIAERFDAVAA
ncbi:FMN-dependent NADH-azoreductase [Dongia rigui]|uniref:FMN dependent NADH:quinone oxidoreductase n=1 Tax=Dongia rigui TaxID=940149 RepID=A0ABU5E0X8_9PROT|nr:NAD(P)H-dependent oxidoreductase [Dongia rigui]MDY0872947.1 NAD(P)H-dependent oxidoreductase [Dongia rigui]